MLRRCSTFCPHKIKSEALSFLNQISPDKEYRRTDIGIAFDDISIKTDTKASELTATLQALVTLRLNEFYDTKMNALGLNGFNGTEV